MKKLILVTARSCRLACFVVILFSSLTACTKAKPALISQTQAESGVAQKDAPVQNFTENEPPAKSGDLPATVQVPLDAGQVDQLHQRFELGVRLLEKNEHVAARVLFEDLVAAHPNITIFQTNLGVSYRRLGMQDEALKAYQQAISIATQQSKPLHPETQYNLGILLRDRGDFKGAEAAYRAALALDPDFQDAHYNLAVLYELYLNQPAPAIAHYKQYLVLSKTKNEEIDIWIAGLERRLPQPEANP